jgi:acetyl-CoA acyltransferase 2
MSDAPLVVRGNDARWGVKLSAGLSMRDALWDGLTDSYGKIPMGMTAENLAKQYNISREVSFQKYSPAHSSSDYCTFSHYYYY